MIRFNCPVCGMSISVRDEHAGKKGTCSGCGEKMRIPAPTTVVERPKQEQWVVNGGSIISDSSQSMALQDFDTIQTHVKPGAAVQVNVSTSRGSHSLGVASLILGILSFFVMCLPYIGFGFAVVAFSLGLLGFFVAMARRGAGIGYSIAGITVSIVALCIGGMWTFLVNNTVSGIDDAVGQIREAGRRAQEAEDAKNPGNNLLAEGEAKDHAIILPEKIEPEWIDASQPSQLGDIQIQITSVDVGKVPLISFTDTESKSENNLLLVRYRVTNTSKQKKIDYRGYMDPKASLLNIVAGLTDNHGNRYRGIDFGFGTKVKDTSFEESIYPGGWHDDAVVFERPIEGVEFLRLTLDGESIGQDGDFRIQIPANIITHNGRMPNVKVENKVARPIPPKAQKTEQPEEILEIAKSAMARNPAYAKRRLTEIIEKYPDTDAATEAKKILDSGDLEIQIKRNAGKR